MMDKNEHAAEPPRDVVEDETIRNNGCELNDPINEFDQSSSPTHFPTDSSKCEPLSSSSSSSGPVNKKVKTITEDVNQVLNSQCLNPAMQAPLLLMAGQHGILPPQLQQILRQIPGADLQLILQQQQSMILQHQQQQQKLQEGLLHQLNEQLQVNFIQLSQLVQQQQQNEKKSCKQTQQQIQQLGVQQQQLLQQIQQIQLTQRQYLMAYLSPQLGALHQDFNNREHRDMKFSHSLNKEKAGMMSPDEIQQLWKEVSEQSGIEEKMVKKNNLDISSPSSAALSQSNLQNGHFVTNGNLPNDHNLLPGGSINRPPVNILHNDSPIKTKPSDLDGTACSNWSEKNPLYRHNFCKWPGCDTHCEDFKAFIKHINHEHVLDDKSTAQARVQSQVVSQLEMQLTREKELLQGMMQHLHVHMNQPMSLSPSTLHKFIPTTTTTPQVHNDITCLESNPKLLYQNQPTLSQEEPLPSLPAALPVSITSLPMTSSSMSLTIPPTSSLQLPHSPSAHSSLNVTTSSTGPMRRRVSDKCNLPISAEIQRNRDFYKHTDVRPPFTYASLIRQSIIESPHRQLTLNEIYQWFQNTFSYFRRNEATWKNAVRHNLSLHKCFMRVENVKGAVWTVDEIEFYRRRPQKLSGAMKSPTYSEHSSFNESLNTSLQAAIGESSFSIMSNSTGTQDSAEDLSMKISDQEELYRDEQMFKSVKQESDDTGLSDDQLKYTDRPGNINQSDDLEEVLDEDNTDLDGYTNSSTSDNHKWNFALDSKCKNTLDQHNNKTSKSEDLKAENEILDNLGRFSHVSQDMVLSVPPSVV